MVGITAFGGYVPRLRLARKAIVAAHVWADPGLKGKARGERSMCNWDEDAVTMGVEAARNCLASTTAVPDAVLFASTSAPFADRQNAGVISTALSLGEDLASIDVGASQRAGVTRTDPGVCERAERAVPQRARHRRRQTPHKGRQPRGTRLWRRRRSGDDRQRSPLLEFVAAHSATVDFVDHFRAATEAFDYTWEERWIRDEGLSKIVPPVIAKVLPQGRDQAVRVSPLRHAEHDRPSGCRHRKGCGHFRRRGVRQPGCGVW